MQNTRNQDDLAAALLDLIGFLNSPRRDDILLRAARVDLDRALFPLLVRLGMLGPLSVAELADHAGRDHTTVSRQLAKLEEQGLIERVASQDRRRRAAGLTETGQRIVTAIGDARRRALAQAMAGWSGEDRVAFTALTRRFVDDLAAVAKARTTTDPTS